MVVGLQRSGIQLISDFVRGQLLVGVKDTADVAAVARSCFGFPAKKNENKLSSHPLGRPKINMAAAPPATGQE